MERKNAWKKYDDAALEELERVAAGYIEFISTCKTERECAAEAIRQAEAAGYKPLAEAIAAGAKLGPGSKIWAHANGKALILLQLGQEPLAAGMNILGAHIDSPRLDIKQNPLYESSDFALLDTHYYGGIKYYQWVTLPLAIHGVVAKKDGSVAHVNVGEDASDPVFCVTDLLIHLANEQMQKTGNKIVEGEDLDVLVGSRPLVVSAEASSAKDTAKDATYAATNGADAQPAAPVADEDPESLEAIAKKEPVKAYLLQLLKDKYGMDEEDFLSAELEVVPAGRARELGFDRSMVIGYGQDDRVCAYTSLIAQLAIEQPQKTAVCILVDKEEIGSVGATGMTSRFFENTIAEVLALTGSLDASASACDLALRRALCASSMLSSDVSAGLDPAYAAQFDAKNAAFLGRGIVFNKYTGARGKSGSNDANAEYVARIRRIMDEANVSFQTAELGKVNAGGGGTIAYIPAEYGMDVIDAGVAVLSMHAPWEVTSKADIYEAYKAYQAFLSEA